MKSVILFLGVLGLATQAHAQTNDCYTVQNAYYYNSEDFTCPVSSSINGETLRKQGTYNLGSQDNFNSNCCRDSHHGGSLSLNNAGGKLESCSSSQTLSYQQGNVVIEGDAGCSNTGRDISGQDYYVLGTYDTVQSNFVLACCNEPTVCKASEITCSETSSPTGSYEIYDETNFQETCCVTTCETSGNTCSENSFPIPTFSTEIYGETIFQETCCISALACGAETTFVCSSEQSLIHLNEFAIDIESGSENGFQEKCCCANDIVNGNIEYAAIHPDHSSYNICKTIALADLADIKTENEAATPSGECLALSDAEKTSIQAIIDANIEQFDSNCNQV